MKAVFLDKLSLDKDDLDFSSLMTNEYNWTFYDQTSINEVCERTKDAEVIVCNKVIVDKKVIDNAQHLKLICIAATGTNNVDLEYARIKGVTVCNVRAYGTPSVVQHVFVLLLMLLRNIPLYQSAVKNGAWQNSKEFCLLDYPIGDLSGKTLGIIGYGEIGQALARVAEAFGMEVLATGRRNKDLLKAEKNEKLSAHKIVSLAQLLSNSDVISLHCPLTGETRNLISYSEFEKMKPSAYLINVARGGIVNEIALKEALIANKIAGAAIDVLAEEPPKSDSILLKLDLPNLLITPYIAWASRTARQNLLNQVANNILQYYSGNEINCQI